jgi:hypothetical protein
MAQSVRPGNDGSIPGRGKIFFFHSVEIGSDTPPSLLSSVCRLLLQSECEADHSPTYSGEVQNAWTYASVPPYVFMGRC